MTTATASAPKLNFGSRDDFERVRQALKAASYDEETILRTLKIERMSDVGGINFNSIDFSDSTPQFCTILKLFFGQRPVSIAELEGAFDRQTLTSFKSLGLIGESASDLAYARYSSIRWLVSLSLRIGTQIRMGQNFKRLKTSSFPQSSAAP